MRLPRLLNTASHLRMLSLCGMVACLGLLGGCDVPSFFDPGELGGLRERAREPLVVPILSEIDPVREQVNRSFATAQEPLPEDFITAPADYTVGPNDLLEVTIYDLEGPGLQTIKRTRVSGTGNITLPFLTNVVPAQGLTEIEIQNAIADAYSKAGILERAQVSVSVFEARNQAFTISGAVGREGLFQIIDEDFRIFDALAQAGGVQSPFQEDVYVIRKPQKRKSGGADSTTAPTDGATTQPIEDLAPPQGNSGRRSGAMKKSVLLQAAGGEAPEGAADPTAPVTAPVEGAAEVLPEDTDAAARVGRIDGQDVVVEPGAEAVATPAAEPPAESGEAMAPANSARPFEFDEMPGDHARIIRIPLDKLRTGEFDEHNIVIRHGDKIYVPAANLGFYYMNGHVAGTGAYSLQGQRVTLMDAIAAARGLDGLAIPQRTDVIRKIGTNEKMFFRVDLASIYAGKSPDVYLKPGDQVLVGTNILAPFLAAIRGGFRMTYGFGFLYDRNYAYDDNFQSR